MARLALRVGSSLVALAAMLTPCVAGDGWNPFDDTNIETNRPPPRKARQAPLPAPDTLPPMEGVSSRPWAQPSTPAPAYSPPVTASPAPGQADEPSWRQSAPVSPPPAAAYPPVRSGELPPPAGDTVQRGDLAPVMSADGSGLPLTFWQGVDPAALAGLIAPLSLPPRSAALAGLWRRLWTSEGLADPETPRGKDGAAGSFAAVRIEALYRSGMVADLAKVLKDRSASSTDPIMGVIAAKARIAVGDRESGCSEIKGLQRAQSSLPKPLRSEFLMLAALCGAGGGDANSAGLAADLLRAEGVDAPLALGVLDALASGTRKLPKAALGKRLSLIEYRFLALLEADRIPGLVAAAEPALLAVLAAESADPVTRIEAAETAAAFHALGPSELAAAYRAAPGAADGAGDASNPIIKRGQLFKAIEAERTPMRKARMARTLLDEVRRAHGPYLVAAAMLSPALGDLRPTPELGWFAETAIEINLAAGRTDAVRAWAVPEFGERAGGLRHWLVLADIADHKWTGRRGDDLVAVEQFALRGRLAPELMHRLVTVLDALDYQIPIPLWEAASRTPQPSSGHLPETGVLSQLQEASKRKEYARTVLTALRTIGPDSGDTAHMIALGDTIRALRRAGLDADARRLGLEALFAGWPRLASN
ncbi:MAG: hypothetical protein JSS20_02940 [Proteobacteria bacterium]|nr:hypothetical protein [Pseudomonadota bacterium]